MNDEATTATVESGYTELVTLTEGSSSTTAQEAFVHAVPLVIRQPEHTVRHGRSVASLLRAYLQVIGTCPSAAVVKSGAVFFPGFERHDEDDLETSEPRDAASRRKRYAGAIALLDEWLADDSGYDEETWQSLKEGIERTRTSSRRRFSD